jgi:hypothetical protein
MEPNESKRQLEPLDIEELGDDDLYPCCELPHHLTNDEVNAICFPDDPMDDF